MFIADERLRQRVLHTLDLNCESPEEELNTLSRVIGHLPEGKEEARIRRVALDVDDLTSQIRWHLGQALYLMEAHSSTLKSNETIDAFGESGWHSGALLLLRGFTRDANKVVFSGPEEQRRGSTAAGWVFHILIDGAVLRAVAVLDRLSFLLLGAAELRTSKPYFRPKQVRQIAGKLPPSVESSALLELVNSAFVKYLMSYRDGLAHTTKRYSRVAGARPADSWETQDGKRVFWDPDHFDSEDLFALGSAAFDHAVQGLRATVPILARKWPLPSKGEV